MRPRTVSPPTDNPPPDPVREFAGLVEAVARRDVKAMKSATRDLKRLGFSVVYVGKGGRP